MRLSVVTFEEMNTSRAAETVRHRPRPRYKIYVIYVSVEARKLAVTVSMFTQQAITEHCDDQFIRFIRSPL